MDKGVMVVVVGMDIHKMLSIGDSRMANQGVIRDGRRIPVKSFKELFGAVFAQWLMV